ncbi:MAG: hypothetical protein ACTSUE_15055 [Promethearchaeota archaeon]
MSGYHGGATWEDAFIVLLPMGLLPLFSVMNFTIATLLWDVYQFPFTYYTNAFLLIVSLLETWAICHRTWEYLKKRRNSRIGIE